MESMKNPVFIVLSNFIALHPPLSRKKDNPAEGQIFPQGPECQRTPKPAKTKGRIEGIFLLKDIVSNRLFQYM
jgi:hypothetical protein